MPRLLGVALSLTIATGVLSLSACGDVFGPSASRVVRIFEIDVPAQALATDTVRVAFSYMEPGCRDGEVEVRQAFERVVIAVRALEPPPDRERRAWRAPDSDGMFS